MSRLLDRVRTHPSAVLLTAQLLQVLAWPFLLGSTAGRAVLGVLGMVAVAAAVYAVRRTPALSRVVVFLGAPAMAFTLLEALQPTTSWVVLTSAVLHAPFYV